MPNLHEGSSIYNRTQFSSGSILDCTCSDTVCPIAAYIFITH